MPLSSSSAGTPGRNLYAAFHQNFPANRSLPALLTVDGRAFSYADVEKQSAGAANWLIGKGLQPGDRLTVQAAKSVPWLWLYLGCLRTGAVFHPLNDGYQARELAYFIADARPGLVVCDPTNKALFQSLASSSETTIETLDAAGEGSAPDDWAGAPDSFPTVSRDRDDPAVLLYSSGTTGQPKGALQTHGSLLSNVRTLVGAWEFTPADRLLHALPVYHAHGLFVGVGCTLMSGASMVYLPRFDVDDVIDHLPDCTVMMGVPTFYTRLLASPAFTAERCRNVRVFISGSAPLTPETFAAFEQRTGQRILERYGMTETGMNSSNPLHGERRPGSVGPALPGVRIRIVDDDGRVLPPTTVGHIELTGPNVFPGYWNRPEETAEAFTADGWFRTGDRGSLSVDGYLDIAGRSKDLIISGGLNVYPREVELVLDGLPGVEESAVIGVPHPDFGEGVVAVVVASNHPATEEDILEATRNELAAFKRPKRVFFLPELPRNAMGKVQKAELRRQFGLSLTPPEETR